MGSGKKSERWASDEDANELLAGILDETEEDARSEQARIEAELEAKEAQERHRREEEREQKRADARARITAEEKRLEGLEKRRTMRQEALRIEELEERGEYVEEQEPTKPDDHEDPSAPKEDTRTPRRIGPSRADTDPRDHRVNEALRETQQTPIATASVQPSNLMPVIALAAVFALVAGAGATAFMLAQGSYEPDGSVYSKSVYQPREPRDMQVSVGFTPVAEKPDERTSSPRVRPDPPRVQPSAPTRPATATRPNEESEESSTPELPDFDESGFDPFGEGP